VTDNLSYRPSSLDAGAPLITFSGVCKKFGPKVVYDGLDLTINKGETITVMGGSGVGKSVLLKLLIGLLRVDSGTIWYDGADVTKCSEREFKELRRRIGMLFQGAALFDSMSVLDNVAYGLRERQPARRMPDSEVRARVENSLALVGLPGIEQMMPSDLSGGMRKRVGLARCIASQPEVILYDEPTTGLDPVNTARINALIKQISEAIHVTSIVVTHDMGTAFGVSDRLAMIYKGRVQLVGTPDEFRNSDDQIVRQFIEGRAPEGETVATLLAL
jgi:phospholipid/cholesterol/gamma-HCH transport system ATP-binding protein